jgi:hypothetical protein
VGVEEKDREGRRCHNEGEFNGFLYVNDEDMIGACRTQAEFDIRLMLGGNWLI